ncbi:putative DNA-3-methyladenine glycosylase [Aspergillus steynii IBT 23096]|uniref:Putative DNA-3-methyladenine glycosylase n=1 Tax=Aspergillus steynii IBT 23096 TaxID=1392250 RepID=A0A2I2GNE4_9EURO|nr:putative DNA-3-methyladenine glycosylase [Aspergillus steynii IBT 23096]PLB54397.1 putative DNA-3-methyladenine glycosylase [Aspergillus steynii IBT 23096]
MMALRRSARLSATPGRTASPLWQPSTQTNKASRAQLSSNGVSKARKAPEKSKNARNSKLNKTLADALPSKTLTAQGAGGQAPENIFDPSSTSNGPTHRPHSTPPPLDRPVELHGTNAPLLTPHGSSLVAYPPGAEDASPSKTGRPRPTATTGTLLEQAIAHLIAADPRLEPVIKQHPCPLFSPGGLAEEIDPFKSLVVSIIGQQVSGAAAKSIRDKFVALFNEKSDGDDAKAGNRFPTPEEIIQFDIPTLRTAGLSQRKAEYIQGLSQKFADGELSARMLLNASDEELLKRLTAVRGLGQWSVEMFACFALKRIDVFSTGDLGVQRGCAAFVGKDVNKLKAKGGGKFKYMAEKDMLELAAKFAPYRSLFMWYMWRIENVDIAVLNP